MLTGEAEEVAEVALPVEERVQRNNIFDRNLSELAVSFRVSSVYVKPLEFDNIEETVALLAGTLEFDEQQMLTELKTQRSFKWLVRNISPSKAAEIESLKLNGVYFYEEDERFYPSQVNISHVIGEVKDEHGLSGIESFYDTLLRWEIGEPGTEDEQEDKPVAGKDLILTLDVRMQKALEKEKLERIIQAGRFAPTGANRQGLQYVVLHRAESIQMIRGMALEALLNLAQKIETVTAKAQKTGETLPLKYQLMQFYPPTWRNLADLNKQGIDKLFYHAPALIIGHFNPSESVTPNMDPGLSAMQMLLMAEALELGTCLSGFTVFALEESSELRKTVQIPEGHQVPFAFMLGYPDVTFDRLVSRKPAKVKWL